MIDFEGRSVVVTGSGGGVGSALVEVLAELNARVIGCDVEGADLSSAAISETVYFDLADDEAVLEAGNTIAGKGPHCAVISNAGWTRAETLADVTADNLAHEFNLNFRGTALLTQKLVPTMRNQSGGAAFVFVSSVNAVAHFGNPVYSVAKAGLHAWMRAIATEEGRNGIRANVVIPGSIMTNAWTHRIEQKPDIGKKVSEICPLGRLVEPVEVARAIAFLASPWASGITGAELPVDAGVLAGNLPFLGLISD